MRNKLQSFWNDHPQCHKDVGRVLRFGVTGSLSTGLHYCAYLLALLAFNATISYTIGYGVGLVFNYFMTTHFTFKKQSSKKNAAGFLASHIINYLLEIGLLNLLMHFEFGKQLAGIMTLVMIVPINFLLLRFVFVKLK